MDDGLEHLQWAKDFLNRYEEKKKKRNLRKLVQEMAKTNSPYYDP